MDYFKQLLEQEKSEYERKGSYSQRIAGDTSEFRYPHLSEVSENFEYDSEIKTFYLKRQIKETITKISTNEITLYELMNKTAKRLHLYDFFGYKATTEEQYEAFQSVLEDYKRNQQNGKWNLDFEIQKVNISNMPIRKEFEHLKTFIRKSYASDVYFCKFKGVNPMFQFGSTLKGTNIVFVDDSKANFCQELFHAIYHLEEGIPGVNDDNMNILEVWGNVDALYLKQLMEGRLARRIRNNTSPHDIKFLDYVFLRAYIGQAFLPENEQATFHSAYALIQPTVKLLVNSMEQATKNTQIIDGICYDKTDEIKKNFNKKYGEGAYEKIYYDFNLFHRMTAIGEVCEKRNISYEKVLSIMFAEENNLLPTVIDTEVVKAIWLNSELHQNKELIFDLIEDYSQEARNDNFKITIEQWLEHIKEKFGKEQYETVKQLCSNRR